MEVYSLKVSMQHGLPPNLWFMIFRHLDVISLLRAAEVCRLWQSWSRNDQSWTSHVTRILKICPVLHDTFERVKQRNGENIQITTGKQIAKEPAKKRRRRGKSQKAVAARPYERMKGFWNVFANRLLSRHRSKDKFCGSFILCCIFEDFFANFETFGTENFKLVNERIESKTGIGNIQIDKVTLDYMEISVVYCLHQDVWRRNYSSNFIDWNLVRKIVIGEAKPTLDVVRDTSGTDHWENPDNYFGVLMENYHPGRL